MDKKIVWKILWTEPALTQLETIVDYLAEQSSSAAQRVGEAILDRVETLSSFPFAGSFFPADSDGPIREILAAKYRIFYRVDETTKTVEILSLWHGSRGEPEILD